jgi:hypothetical protein
MEAMLRSLRRDDECGEQQQMEMSQKKEAPSEKATASQSRASMRVPSVEWMPSTLRLALRAPTTVLKRMVETTAAMMVKRVAAWSGGG